MSFRSPFILLRNLFAALLHLWHRCLYTFAGWLRKDTATYVTLELQQEYPFGPPQGIAKWFQQDLSWLELRELLIQVKDSPDIDGLVVSTDGLELGMARASSIRNLLDDVRESGKHVVGFLEGSTTAEYMLATAADDILMSPVDSIFTFGPRFDQTFAKKALDTLDVDPQFIHLGDFKTATHTAIHDSMTTPQSGMMRQLYDRLTGELTNRVAQRRSLDADTVGERLFGNAPQDAGEAVRQDLIDHGVFYDRIQSWLMRGDDMPAISRHDEWIHPDDAENTDDSEEKQSEYTADESVPAPTGATHVDFLELEDSPAVMKPTFNWWRVLGSSPKIAVLNLSGPIVDSADQLPIQQSSIITPDDAVPALQQLRDDPDVAGVVAHINSPGGSATASDVIWQAMADLADTVPLAAYCTDVAASGGYYLASAAPHITCHNTTMTGSIGVVLGKISSRNLPERVGLNVESIHNYESDTFTSLVHPLGDEMMERLDEQGRAFYRRFLERVGQARDIPRRRLHRYARGRVYFGRDAEHRGLVDELGGFQAAYSWVLDQSDVSRDDAELSYVEHRQRGLSDVAGFPGLASMTDGSVEDWLQTPDSAIANSLLRRLYGDSDAASNPADISPALLGALLQQEHLLAVSPLQITWSE